MIAFSNRKMTEALGQPVVVDNRAGASGHIAMEITARASPDGYTRIMSTVAPVAFSPALFRNLPFDSLKDYAPVAASSTVFVIVVPPSVPARSVKELIALAKSQAGDFTVASGGTGGASHVAAEMFQMMAGAKMLHVPFKGGGAALPEVISRRVSMLFADVIGARQLVATGKLVALGVSSSRRSAMMRDVPTIAEAGLPQNAWVASSAHAFDQRARKVMRSDWKHVLACGLLGAAASTALGQEPGANQPGAWPVRTVRLIVPSGPGGGVDTLGRLFGKLFYESLGQRFVIDNRVGGRRSDRPVIRTNARSSSRQNETPH